MAADWSNAMLAVYDFEDPSALGSDRSGHDNHLTAQMVPVPYDSEPPQGAHAVSVDSPNGIGFISTSTDFHSPSGTTFTIGGWFHTEFIYTQPVGRASDAPDLGYSIGRGDTSSAFCFVGDGAWSNVVGLDVWPDFTWTHVVCRYDFTTKYSTGFANGEVFGSGLQMDVLNAARELEVPSFDNGYRYQGEMDEVFFVKQPLSDAAIARIWACGIDGTRCRCRLDDPATYTDCGRASPTCDALPPCDAATP
jgi:hypothetical protein